MATYDKIEWDKLNESETQEFDEMLGFQQHKLDIIADKIKEGTNISPKVISKLIRNLFDVGIPSEILIYISDYLDGKKLRGKPAITTLGLSKHEFEQMFIELDIEDIMFENIWGTSDGGERGKPKMTKEKAIECLALKQLGIDPDNEEAVLMVDPDELERMCYRIKNKLKS